jgi:hypothetical protein
MTATDAGQSRGMADDSREEDLTELDGPDAIYEKIKELTDDGWQPTKLTLVRTEGAKKSDPEESEGLVLRDDPPGV